MLVIHFFVVTFGMCEVQMLTPFSRGNLLSQVTPEKICRKKILSAINIIARFLIRITGFIPKTKRI